VSGLDPIRARILGVMDALKAATASGSACLHWLDGEAWDAAVSLAAEVRLHHGHRKGMVYETAKIVDGDYYVATFSVEREPTDAERRLMGAVDYEPCVTICTATVNQ
jgi:hypothetical protein